MLYLIIFFINISVLITSGCRFYLRDTFQIPEELKTLKLKINDSYSPLERAIRHELRLINVNLIDDNIQNVPILKIINSSENIETVSVYQDGKSAEKQLDFFISGEIILPNNIVYSIKTRVTRTFFDNPLETLAKDAENKLIKQEMHEQAAHQLIRELFIVNKTIKNNTTELAN
ncbi:MAG: LPS assembly lipoprotein LptE [Arsenophonus sp.]